MATNWREGLDNNRISQWEKEEEVDPRSLRKPRPEELDSEGNDMRYNHWF